MLNSGKFKTILIILIFCLPIIAWRGTETTVPDEISVAPEPTISSDLTIISEPAQSSGTPVTQIDQIVGTWMSAADVQFFLSYDPS